MLPILLLAAWSLSINPEALSQPQLLERVYVFDFLISLPALYFLFLGKKVSLKAALLRSAALAATGLWLASKLMPAGEGEILPWLAGLRYIALPLLLIVELATVVAITRYAYGETRDEGRLIESGVPPLIAKAMLAEARLWKRVARWMRGR